MASSLSLSPPQLRLLRLAPLLTSTATLWFAVDEDFFLSILPALSHQQQPQQPQQPGSSRNLRRPDVDTTALRSTLPAYFARFFFGGFRYLIPLNLLTLGTAGLNLYLSPAGRTWFRAGLALQLAHFAFVPAVMYPVQRLAETARRNTEGRSGEVAGKEAGNEGDRGSKGDQDAAYGLADLGSFLAAVLTIPLL
ncbi:hypothetical protein H2203_005415 [Taxawa tesnikishii (nom. ined.)]|nr:hypothetical protein H2203_005415 [Dothideales sp. JES 119]